MSTDFTKIFHCNVGNMFPTELTFMVLKYKFTAPSISQEAPTPTVLKSLLVFLFLPTNAWYSQFYNQRPKISFMLSIPYIS